VSSVDTGLAAAGLPALPRTAWLQIDLDALRGNLAALRSLAGEGVAVHPVVKADAYGHGALPVTLALEAAGADGFCVAALDEAFALRAGGVRAPIRVLYPVPTSLAGAAAREHVMVSAGDPQQLGALLAAVEGAGGAGGAGGASVSTPTASQPLGVEIEVETGLGRGGFPPEALTAAATAVAAARNARLVGLWTHLQASEDADRTRDQLERFEAATDRLRDSGIAVPARHVAASGGLFTGVASLDGVRPGLAIYGIVPDELAGRDLPTDVRATIAALRPVMSLHARPVRVADLPAGHGVSYGPTFTTARPSRIATLPLGYGDGFARAFSNQAEALVRGVRAPLVGNVAMDAIMFDVTDVPGPPVTTDDGFVLLGSQDDEEITVEDLARTRTTNTWEVVTQMAARLPRVYHAAAGPVGLRTLTER
jgi:alanine racemase